MSTVAELLPLIRLQAKRQYQLDAAQAEFDSKSQNLQTRKAAFEQAKADVLACIQALTPAEAAAL